MATAQAWITGWPSSVLDRIWESVLPHIRKAIRSQERLYTADEERLTADSIYHRCRRAEWQLWTTYIGDELTGTILTGLNINTNGALELTIHWVCGSHIHETLNTYYFIEEWARSKSCILVRSLVRPGILPLMKQLGFTETPDRKGRRVWVEKELF